MAKTQQHVRLTADKLKFAKPYDIAMELARASTLLEKVVKRQMAKDTIQGIGKDYLKEEGEHGRLGKSQTVIRLSGYIETLSYRLRMQAGIWIEGQTFD